MLCFGTQQRNEASMWIAKLTLHYGSGLVFLQYGKLWLCPHSLTKHYMACRTSLTGGLMESSFKGPADTLILVARTLLCCFYANFCTKTSLLACTVPTYLSDMTKQQLEAAACCRRQPSLAVFLLACWVWSHCTGKRANSPVSFLVRRGHAHIPSSLATGGCQTDERIGHSSSWKPSARFQLLISSHSAEWPFGSSSKPHPSCM